MRKLYVNKEFWVTLRYDSKYKTYKKRMVFKSRFILMKKKIRSKIMKNQDWENNKNWKSPKGGIYVDERNDGIFSSYVIFFSFWKNNFLKVLPEEIGSFVVLWEKDFKDTHIGEV